MLLATHHGKAGTANRIKEDFHVSADAGPFTITGLSTHTKITQRKHLLFGVVGACGEPPRRCTVCKGEGRKEGGKERGAGEGRDVPVSLGTWAAD